MTVFRFLADMKSRSVYRFFPLLPALLLAACASAPQAPANNPVSAAPLPLESSVISIPVSIDLAQLGRDLLRQLPQPLVSHHQKRMLPVRFSAMHTSYAVEPGVCSVTELSCLTRNSVKTVAADYVAPAEADIAQRLFVRDISLSMEGNQIALTARIDFSVDTAFNATVAPMGVASCGSGRQKPGLEMMLGGYVSWSPQGDVVISPKPYQLHWLQPCNITAFPFNADELLDLPALRDRLQAAMEEKVFSRLRQDALRLQLERAWTELNTPREIRPGVWLLPRPDKVAFAGLEGRGRYISTGVLVTAHPEVVKGEQPPAVVVPPVPLPERGISSSEGMHMAIRGDISLVRAQALLNQQLGKRQLQVNGEAVTIQGVRLYGHADKAVLALSFAAPHLAEIYLLGRPVYDLEHNQVHFEGLEYSPQTRDYLRRTATWLLGEGLPGLLQAQATFPFDDTLAGALQEFQDLNLAAGQDMTLRGGIQRMQPQALYFTPDSLVASVLVEGRLALETAQK